MKMLTGGCLFLALSMSMISYGKTANPLCNGVTGSNFTSGNGTLTNPYLICNRLQLSRLSAETGLLTQHFKLGADISYQGVPFNIIGSDVNPFQASFNGDGYTLSAITLQIPVGRINYNAPFGFIRNARIDNLFINGMTQTAADNTAYDGGLVGRAENAILTNVQINGLNMRGSDRSGGLIGYAITTTLQRCSVNGLINIHSDSDGVGGLVGRADNSDISSCSTNTRILQRLTTAGGVSNVGGLFGYLGTSRVRNVYARGDIDYSNVRDASRSISIGGLVGVFVSSSMSKAYYAGRIINVNANLLGGAIGTSSAATLDAVIWDVITSGLNTSAGGTGSTTCLMTQSSFWVNNGFDATIWRLVNGSYPIFVWQ